MTGVCLADDNQSRCGARKALESDIINSESCCFPSSWRMISVEKVTMGESWLLSEELSWDFCPRLAKEPWTLKQECSTFMFKCKWQRTPRFVQELFIHLCFVLILHFKCLCYVLAFLTLAFSFLFLMKSKVMLFNMQICGLYFKCLISPLTLIFFVSY